MTKPIPRTYVVTFRRIEAVARVEVNEDDLSADRATALAQEFLESHTEIWEQTKAVEVVEAVCVGKRARFTEKLRAAGLLEEYLDHATGDDA